MSYFGCDFALSPRLLLRDCKYICSTTHGLVSYPQIFITLKPSSPTTEGEHIRWGFFLYFIPFSFFLLFISKQIFLFNCLPARPTKNVFYITSLKSKKKFKKKPSPYLSYAFPPSLHPYVPTHSPHYTSHSRTRPM